MNMHTPRTIKSKAGGVVESCGMSTLIAANRNIETPTTRSCPTFVYLLAIASIDSINAKATPKTIIGHDVNSHPYNIEDVLTVVAFSRVLFSRAETGPARRINAMEQNRCLEIFASVAVFLSY